MLRLLSVTNFATIDHLELEPAPGLNVLTGETGAGKSIIVDAVNLLVGDRADSTMVRAGADSALVEGVFHLTDAVRDHLNETLTEYGLTLDAAEEELILAREVSLEGRNVCRVNGRIVPLRLLRETGERLIDIHGQGQHLSLLRVREHLDILDRYAGLMRQRELVAEQVNRLNEVRRDLTQIQENEREQARRIDILKYEVQDIEAANLHPGEEEKLDRERTIAANAERLINTISDAYQSLYEGGLQEASAIDLLGRVAAGLRRLESLDESLQGFRETAESLIFQAEDLSRSLRGYRDSIQHSPERFQEIGERLDLLMLLRRKYGDTVQQILEYGHNASAELEALSHSEERITELAAQQAALEAELAVSAGELSEARRGMTKTLAESMEKELSELAMEHTQLEVSVQQAQSQDGIEVNGKRYAFDSRGIDRVEFMISPNPGEPLRPLARIASGGETSRILLALKVILSNTDQIPVLVFDEVDAGIGGRVGTVVGQKLSELSRRHQVLCVTHLPQVASFADRHICVSKAVENGRTVTLAQAVAGTERIAELTEMLGSVSDASRSNAQELLEAASRIKKEYKPGVTDAESHPCAQ